MLTKIVDGQEIVMSATEEAAIRAEWAEHERAKSANTQRIVDIHSQLDAIDKKKTRAITDAILSGDSHRLASLEQEARVLREKLLMLSRG